MGDGALGRRTRLVVGSWRDARRLCGTSGGGMARGAGRREEMANPAARQAAVHAHTGQNLPPLAPGNPGRRHAWMSARPQAPGVLEHPRRHTVDELEPRHERGVSVDRRRALVASLLGCRRVRGDSR